MDVFKTLILDTPDSISSITGLGTNVATFLATPTSANLAAALTDETGTGANVFANSPTLVTPVLGAATATSINKVTVTAPASGSTLTIANGKTLTASNTLTLAGTDSTTMTFPATSATIARTDAAQTFTGTQTFTGIVKTTGASGMFQARLDGSDTAEGGANYEWANTAGNRAWVDQLNTANGLTRMYYNGTSWNTVLTLAGTTGAATITGGAGNMTITAGTGNSRTMALQTTTSGGVAFTSVLLNADGSVTLGSGSTGSQILNVGNTSPSANGTGSVRLINSNTVNNWQIASNDNAAGTLEFTPSTATGGSTFTTPRLSLTTTTAVFSSGVTLAVNNTTEATTGGAGSLTTSGGIYAAKKIIAGGSIYSGTGGANTTLELGGTPSANNSIYLNLLGSNSVTNWRISTNDTTAGALEFIPSTATGGSTFTTPRFSLTTTTATFSSGVTLTASNTTEATTAGAGSLTTSGGIYATKKIISGSTTASTSTTTGSLVTAGGLGVAGAYWGGGDATITSNAGQQFYSIAANNNGLAGTYYRTGNGGSLQTWLVGSNISGASGEFAIRESTGSFTAFQITKGTAASSVASFYGTTEATTGGAGSLTSAGGGYFAKDLIAAKHYTGSGSVSANNGVATTLFSVSAVPSNAMVLVHVFLGVDDANNYAAYATIVKDGTAARIVTNDGSLMNLTISGGNVQAAQSSGGTQTINYRYTVL